MSNTKGQQLKVQVNATFTVIGSKSYSDAAKTAVLTPPKGSCRWLVVEFVDDDGQTITFKVNPRLSKENKSLTGRLTDKATGYFMTETAAPGKEQVKAATKDAERKAIEEQLLNIDK